MARKKISPPPPPERGDDDGDDDLVPDVAMPAAAAEPSESDDLAAVLAELGGISDATITVTRIGPNGREERCDRFMASELVDNIDLIRSRFGAGTYWLYGRADGKLVRKRSVTFARTLDEQRDSGTRAPSPSSGDGSLRELFERQAQQQREIFQMVIQLVTSRPPATTDPMIVISAAEKLANLGNRGNGGDDFDRLMRFHKLVRELGGGGGDGGSGLAGAVMEFMRLMREQAPSAPTAQLPAPPGAPPGDSQQMMILVRRALAERLPLLIRGAQSETDPGVYAQLVLDQVPQPFIAPLLEQLHKPEWFTVLVQIDGRVVPHQAWFEALRNEILQATSQDQPPES